MNPHLIIIAKQTLIYHVASAVSPTNAATECNIPPSRSVVGDGTVFTPFFLIGDVKKRSDQTFALSLLVWIDCWAIGNFSASLRSLLKHKIKDSNIHKNAWNVWIFIYLLTVPFPIVLSPFLRLCGVVKLVYIFCLGFRHPNTSP